MLPFLPEQIEQWPVARLKPYAKNARTHSEDQIARIALVEYGWTAPVMVADDGDNVIPEPPVHPVSRPGDLWVLGEHRLLCGDSTKADDVMLYSPTPRQT